MSESTTSPPIPSITSELDFTPFEKSSDLEHESSAESGSESQNTSLDDPDSTRHDGDHIPQLQDSVNSQRVPTTTTTPPSSNSQKADATSPRMFWGIPDKETRNLVHAAAPAGDRCVITLAKVSKSGKVADIAYCYAMPRGLHLVTVRMLGFLCPYVYSSYSPVSLITFRPEQWSGT